jgi:hypothetical protein
MKGKKIDASISIRVEYFSECGTSIEIGQDPNHTSDFVIYFKDNGSIDKLIYINYEDLKKFIENISKYCL